MTALNGCFGGDGGLRSKMHCVNNQFRIVFIGTHQAACGVEVSCSADATQDWPIAEWKPKNGNVVCEAYSGTAKTYCA